MKEAGLDLNEVMKTQGLNLELMEQMTYEFNLKKEEIKARGSRIKLRESNHDLGAKGSHMSFSTKRSEMGIELD